MYLELLAAGFWPTGQPQVDFPKVAVSGRWFSDSLFDVIGLRMVEAPNVVSWRCQLSTPKRDLDQLLLTSVTGVAYYSAGLVRAVLCRSSSCRPHSQPQFATGSPVYLY